MTAATMTAAMVSAAVTAAAMMPAAVTAGPVMSVTALVTRWRHRLPGLRIDRPRGVGVARRHPGRPGVDRDERRDRRRHEQDPDRYAHGLSHLSACSAYAAGR